MLVLSPLKIKHVNNTEQITGNGKGGGCYFSFSYVEFFL